LGAGLEIEPKLYAVVNSPGTDEKPHISCYGRLERMLIGLSGFCVDKIAESGEAYRFEEKITRPSYWQQYREAFRLELNLRLRYIDWQHVAGVYTGGKYVSGGTKEEAFWKTLIAGYPFDANTDFNKIKADYRAWNSVILRFGSLRRWIPNSLLVALVTLKIVAEGLRTFFALTFFLPLYDRSHEPFNEMIQCVAQRKLFRTMKGFVGLAPELAKKGDSVALFKGGRLPLIIRQQGENWIIVGDCYVHGMMDGEVFNVERCGTMWIA
jgi:hypothetical protein